MCGEVITGLAPAQFEQSTEILGHGQTVGILLVNFGSTERSQIEQPPAGARTGEEHLAMIFGDTEHVADHGYRQPEGKVRDGVHMALRFHAIEDLVDDLLDAWAHILDPTSGKRSDHKTT